MFIFSTKFRFESRALCSALYSNSECGALYSAIQVYIQHFFSNSECKALYSPLQVYIHHFIQHLNEELYIRPSRSIFITIFDKGMKISIFVSPDVYSALYSSFECRALYSSLQVYNQYYIQTPNSELFIRLSRSLFNTILEFRM